MFINDKTEVMSRVVSVQQGTTVYFSKLLFKLNENSVFEKLRVKRFVVIQEEIS